MRNFLVSFFLTLVGVTGVCAQTGNSVTGNYIVGTIKGGIYSYGGTSGTGGGGGTTSFTASGPSSGVIAVASTNFTVTVNAGAFNGSQTVTIADASQGGTITPSVGSPGTSSVTVTPTNGATSFTFTYNPIKVATQTLTFTNAQGWTNPTALTYATAASSTQSAALLARMDGSENQVAVDALISGMVTDSTYSLFDGLHVFATNSTTNANLNWAQNAFNLTQVGTVAFATNQGYTSNGSTGYFTTGFNPHTATTPQYVLNSATLGYCDVSSRTTANTNVVMGSNDGTDRGYLQPLNTGPVFSVNINTTAGGNVAGQTNTQGSWITARTSSNLSTVYKNGSSIGTTSTASAATPNDAFFLLSLNQAGTATTFWADQMSYMFYGTGLTSTQASNIYSRLHTYLQAVGETTAC